jgi:(p)ppGpp synthase/HD superfamily hydrolase
VLSDRFSEALVYAARLHREQKRKGTEIPYLSHLMSVASLALEHGASEDEAIAALLHDSIEDQGVKREDLAQKFGETVAEIVWACTDADTIPKPPWRARKEAYIARILTEGASVRLVSSADKLHNARSILIDLRRDGESVWSRFKGGKEGTLWYYRALVDAFREAGGTPILDELTRVVTELEQLAR